MNTTTTNTTTRNEMVRRNRRNLAWIAVGLIAAIGVFLCWDAITYMVQYNWSPVPHSHNRDVMAYEVTDALTTQAGILNMFTLPLFLVIAVNTVSLVVRIYVNRNKYSAQVVNTESVVTAKKAA